MVSMRLLFSITVALLLAGCVAEAGPSQYQLTPPLVVGANAQTEAMQYSALAQSASTQAAATTTAQGVVMAVATLSAQTTQEALAATPAAGTVVAMQATQAAIVGRSTQDAVAQATSQAINAQQVAATRLALAISVTQEAERQGNQTQAAAMLDYLGVCLGILLLAILAAFSVLLFNLVQASVERRRVQSMLHSTPSGLYLVYVSGDRIISRPVDQVPENGIPELQRSMIAAPSLNAAGSRSMAVDGGSGAALEPSRMLVARSNGRERLIPWLDSTQVLSERQSEAVKLADVLLLLGDAINATRPSGVKIPRYSRLRHWQTRPAAWGKVTDRLVQCGYAEKRSGPPPQGGTYITGGRSLYTLAQALQSGALKLRPSTAGVDTDNATPAVLSNVTQNVT